VSAVAWGVRVWVGIPRTRSTVAHTSVPCRGPHQSSFHPLQSVRQTDPLASNVFSQSVFHVVCADTGLVYLSASLVDEAKRWFKCSTVLCRFIPDGRQCAEKVGRSAAEETTFTIPCDRFRPPTVIYWHATGLDEVGASLSSQPDCTIIFHYMHLFMYL